MKLIIDSKNIFWLPQKDCQKIDSIEVTEVTDNTEDTDLSATSIYWIVDSSTNLIKRYEHIENHVFLKELIIFTYFDLDSSSIDSISEYIDVQIYKVPIYSIFQFDSSTKQITITNDNINQNKYVTTTFMPEYEFCFSTKYLHSISRHDLSEFQLQSPQYLKLYITSNLYTNPIEFYEEFKIQMAYADQMKCPNVIYGTDISCNVVAIMRSEYGDYLKAHETFSITIKQLAKKYRHINIILKPSEKGNYLSSQEDLIQMVEKINEPNVIQIDKRSHCFTQLPHNDKILVDYPFGIVFGKHESLFLDSFFRCLTFGDQSNGPSPEQNRDENEQDNHPIDETAATGVFDELESHIV